VTSLPFKSDALHLSPNAYEPAIPSTLSRVIFKRLPASFPISLLSDRILAARVLIKGMAPTKHPPLNGYHQLEKVR
jgi:hypothetical protein